MTSSIVRTNPTAGTATTSSVRDNFGHAADEINRLLRASTDKATTANSVTLTATFANVPTFTLVDGIRVLLEVAVSNTNTSPTLNVNSTGDKNIKKADGTSLAAGDLVAGGYYEFVYDSGEDEWKVLNLTISKEKTLLETILGGLYPVGSLLTTTVATDPGDADYFFSGITFGTWAAYAQGRTVVGIDTGFGTGFVSGSKTLDQVTIVIAEKALSKGDSITVSGFTGTSAVANGSQTVISAVTATGQTTVIYSVADVTDLTSLVGTDVKVINEDFDTSQEIGGENKHQLTYSELADHNHQWYITGGGANKGIDTTGVGTDDRTYDTNGDPITLAGGGGSELNMNAWTSKKNSVSGGEDANGHNNLQPYIVNYIWKRTA